MPRRLRRARRCRSLIAGFNFARIEQIEARLMLCVDHLSASGMVDGQAMYDDLHAGSDVGPEGSFGSTWGFGAQDLEYGIRNLADARAMLAAGASRLGTSATAAILGALPGAEPSS
jgi:hypothetical protein